MKQIGFESIKKRKKSVYPNQYICEEKANGVICNGNFYPFRTKNSGPDSGGFLPKKIGVAYFIRTCNMSVKCTGITAAGIYSAIYGYQNGESKNLITIHIPEMTLATDYFGFMQDLQVFTLLDFDRQVTAQNQGGGNQVCTFGITYAEIDVLPGERNPKAVEE